MSASRYSLVVLTHNRPLALHRCLASIEQFAWSGPAPEVIVVDDGSVPPSKPVLEKHPGLKPIYVYQPNKGVAAARNAGLRAATGDCVAFIADDYVLPKTYLADVDEFFASNPDAQVITHNLAPRGRGLFSLVQRLYMQLALGQELKVGALKGVVVKSFTLPAARAAVFRRAIFERVGNFNETLRVGEDGDLTMRLAGAGVPVHMFFWKMIDHYEGIGVRGYLRQRVRYGRSFVRALANGPAKDACTAFRNYGIAGIGICIVKKIGQWWGVASNLHKRVRFLVLWPLLGFYLSFFYLGAYLEFRSPGRRA